MSINSGRALLNFLVFMWLAVSITGATAQTYPDRPVTVVVAVAAGGLTDVLTRAVSQRLAEKWASPSSWRTGLAEVIKLPLGQCLPLQQMAILSLLQETG